MKDSPSVESWRQLLAARWRQGFWSRRLSVRRKRRALSALLAERLGAAPSRLSFLGRSKCGNDSFRVTLADGRQLKAYECWSAGHAERVVTLSRALLANGVDVAEPLLCDGRFVIAEWVIGDPVDLGDPRRVEALARMQARLHRTPVPATVTTASFENRYLDFLSARLFEFAQGRVTDADAAQIAAALAADEPTLETRITHPDLTPDNLVVRGDRLVSIDNESLSAGPGFEYDILNTQAVLAQRSLLPAGAYTEIYARHGELGTLETAAPFWLAIWELRQAGRLLQVGDLDAGLAAARRIGARPR